MNYIPIIGWLISFLLNIFLAIPFWFIWTFLGIGASIFPFLPDTLLAPGFLATVGAFMCLSILRELLLPSVQSNSDKN